MNNDFQNIMSKRTDDELISITTVERDGYQATALEAAEAEIIKRGIETSKIKEVEAVLEDKIQKQQELDKRKVGAIKRIIHVIVDGIAICLLTFILSFIILDFFDPTNEAVISILVYLALAAGFFGYYIFMESFYGKTLGKFITKTRVVTVNGDKPTTVDIVRRTACRLIPWDFISYFFTQNGFHDKLSETVIVNDEVKV